MAHKAKDLVKNQGILSNPNPKQGCSLPSTTVNLVKDFYEFDDISRILPGKKDFVSVRQDDLRVHVQKRLLLGNLKEVYQQFKKKHPIEKIGFSKFAELYPQHCVLAEALQKLSAIRRSQIVTSRFERIVRIVTFQLLSVLA